MNINRVNETLLNIYNTEDVRKYKDVITDNFKINQYINIKHLFLISEKHLENKDNNNKDFSIKKLTSDIKQIQYTRKILDYFGMDKYLEMDELVEIDESILNDFINHYKSVFRDNTKQKIELKTKYDRVKFVAGKLYKKLNIPMTTKKVKRDGKVIIEYIINKNEIENYKEIYQYSKNRRAEPMRKYLEECEELNSEMCVLKTNLGLELLNKI